MKPMLLLAAALAVGSTGCLGGGRRPFCPPDSPCQPRVECEQQERVVVHAPKTTCVIEQPTGAPSPPPTGAPSPPPTGAPAPPPMMPTGAPMMPMGAPMMPMGAPIGFSTGAAAPFQVVNAQVRERTGLGFVIDYIRIPIPCIKPIAVPRPAEATFQMQQQQQQLVGYAPMPMQMPIGYGMPMGYGYGGPPVGMVPQATVAYGQATYATQVPVGQVQQHVAPPPPQPPVGAAPKSQQELLEECMKKLEESQRKLQALEKKEPDKK